MSFPAGSFAVAQQRARKFRPGDEALFEALAARTGGTLVKGAFHGTHEGFGFRVRMAAQGHQFILSVVCPPAGRFRITRSGRLDRWLAGFLPALPLPSRDPHFDRDVCVQTRDFEVTGRVVTDESCRRTIRSLLDGPGTAVALEDGRVKLRGPRTALGLAPDVDHILGLLEQLASLARVIADFTRGHEVHQAPKHDAAKVIAWISVIAVFLIGGIALIVGTVQVPLLDPDRFLLTTLGLGLIGVPFAAFGLAHLVARRTAPGRLLFPLVLLALFAVPLASTSTAYLANALLDEGASTYRTAPITHTHTYKDKDNRRYQVGIDAWWAPDEVRWFHTDRSTYEAVSAGGNWSMELILRPGWLDQPWIEASNIVQEGG